MRLNDYQAKAKVTALYREQIARHHGLIPIQIDPTTPQSRALQSLTWTYVLDGLRGELYELAQTHPSGDGFTAEVGDVLWYFAAIATEAGVTLSEVAGCETWQHIYRTPVGTIDLYLLALEPSNRFKKHLRDGRSFDVLPWARMMLQTFARRCDTWGVDMAEAAQSNLDKLADRAARGKIQGDGNKR